MVIAPGSHGVVVREGAVVLAWGTLRELPYGFVTDELWCERTRRGRVALGAVARWLEETVARVAAERGLEYLELGGIVRNENVLHDAALEKRGYACVAKVRSKRICARTGVAVG